MIDNNIRHDYDNYDDGDDDHLVVEEKIDDDGDGDALIDYCCHC